MGLFNKKKTLQGSSSALSENEIQKKLYGEFNVGTPYTAAVEERTPFKQNVHVSEPLSVATPEKEPATDLFEMPEESLVERDLPPRSVPFEPKPVEQTPRYVPIREFEKKSVPPTTLPGGADAYSRFRLNRPGNGNKAPVLDALKQSVVKIDALVRELSDPKQAGLRKILYWSLAVVVVLSLFWGVNKLNSQREKAMSVRYKVPNQEASAPVETLVPAAKTSLKERPVVITPAPVKSLKSTAPGAAVNAKAAGAGYYVIQVVTYPSKQDADKVVNVFRRDGLRAFVKENTRPSGRVFYLVLLGGFKNEAEAQSQLLKFRAKEVARPFQDAFVKSSRT